MQCAMSVSVLLLLTACVSRSVHVSPCGTWPVITLRETLGYADVTCVMSVFKSPLFILIYPFHRLISFRFVVTLCVYR